MILNFTRLMLMGVSIITLQACDLIKIETPKKEEQNEEIPTIYIIPKDQQYSNNVIQLVKEDKIKFMARFDNSAKYTTKSANNQEDINKLYGFSDCGNDHHTNSARFGWRWLNDKLEILAYTYKAGVQKDKHITFVDINKEYTYELECSGDKYIFTLDGKTVEMDRGCSTRADKYKLFPYFGGTENAPHQITIIIKDLKL